MGNPLTDLIPPRARKYVYALATLAVIVYGAWQASEGDWQTFVGALFAALVPGLAASNTKAKKAHAIIGGQLDAGNLTTGSSGLYVKADLVEQGRQIQRSLDAYHRAGGQRPAPGE